MRFEQLEQFVALGVLRHFRQAAEKTQISTSALTRSIQTLEDEIGYELVTRSTRSVKLTKEGELFLEYAKQTLDNLEETKKRLFESLNGCANEKLVIGYTNKASTVVPVSCGQFLAQYPHVKIEMQLQEQSELVRKLQLGEIDISVCSQAMNSIGSDIHLPDQLIIFVAKNHPLAKSRLLMSLLFAIESFDKTSSIKVGSIEQVMDGLKKSNHIAIASIEHTNIVSSDPELLLLKTNKGIAHEQLVIQTNQQINENSHVSHLLDLIEKTALASQG
ncbi:MAG: LysR family transcriptional regulator [Pseudomonadota bacterium]